MNFISIKKKESIRILKRKKYKILKYRKRRSLHKRLRRIANERLANLNLPNKPEYYITKPTSVMPPNLHPIPIPHTLLNLPGSKWYMQNYRAYQNWYQDFMQPRNTSVLEQLENENEILRHRIRQLEVLNSTVINGSTERLNTFKTNKLKETVYEPLKCKLKEKITPCLFEKSEPIISYRRNGCNKSDICEDEDEIEFSNDEEEQNNEEVEQFVAFLNKTKKHQQEYKKHKEEEEARENNKKEPDLNPETRLDIMKRLYGDNAPMILGMELALDMSFKKKMSQLDNPKEWPIIPIRNPTEEINYE
uniref:Uncharacterized protein n=1 Tax=Clastoptera arizonana TaxID=38151 RepID=A0A1B6CZY3_9HEMI